MSLDWVLAKSICPDLLYVVACLGDGGVTLKDFVRTALHTTAVDPTTEVLLMQHSSSPKNSCTRCSVATGFPAIIFFNILLTMRVPTVFFSRGWGGVLPRAKINDRLLDAWESKNGSSGRPPVLGLMGSLVADESFKSRRFLEQWVSK